MTYEGLWEMFEGDFADSCAKKAYYNTFIFYFLLEIIFRAQTFPFIHNSLNLIKPNNITVQMYIIFVVSIKFVTRSSLYLNTRDHYAGKLVNISCWARGTEHWILIAKFWEFEWGFQNLMIIRQGGHRLYNLACDWDRAWPRT